MKKANETVCRFLANLIVHTAEKKVHSACHGYMYEPNVPKKLLEQRKKK